MSPGTLLVGNDFCSTSNALLANKSLLTRSSILAQQFNIQSFFCSTKLNIVEFIHIVVSDCTLFNTWLLRRTVLYMTFFIFITLLSFP
jgi:hypothetical protein